MTDLLDIKIDVVFKDFFGDKNNKEVLENFINSILGLKGDEAIEVEEFLDPRKMRVEVGKPTTFVDLSVKTKGGERYIIEMQTYNHEGFDKRLLYYLGKDYTEQLDYIIEEWRRKKISWKDLPRVHVVAIVDFHRNATVQNGILNGKNVTETYVFRPLFEEDNDHLFDQWRATLVDLKKFGDKPFKDLKKYKEWWFFLLKDASRIKEEEIRKLKENPIFKIALEKLERLSSDPETRKAYEESINEQRNFTAIQEANLREGFEEGREAGREEGEKTKALAIAKELLKNGMSFEKVSEITGLPPQDLQPLLKERV